MPPHPPRIDELTAPPVIGETYLVPCCPHPTIPGIWYPVLGPRHEDAVLLDFEPQHYHYDPRFLDLRLVVTLRGDPAAELRAQEVLTVVHVEEGPLSWRPLRCLREMPAFPEDAYWLRELEEAFRSAQTDCRTCPHRGAPLGGLPVQPGGVVVCPLHGLRWRLQDGRLEPRPR